MDSSQPTAVKGPLVPPTLATAAAAVPESSPSNGKTAEVLDDDSEWEYEYSTTETETYYLTVDMSHKDLVKTPDYYVMNTRGGYRVWMNPLFQQDAKSTKASTFGDDDDNGGDDDQLPEPEGQDDDNIDEVRPRREDVQDNEERSPKDTDPDKSVGDIQILELHSKNPIIAYRGRVFSASWASNIGTELLFVEQDPAAEGALPALRHLPGDIDLLAASSARLLTSLIELKPIEDDTPGGLAAEREAREKRLERARQKHNISIPVVGDRYGKRAPQARFLENLMAIKRLRGETDEVTVHTMETRQNDVEDDPEEMVERRKRAKATERHRKNSHKRQELMRANLGDAHRWGGAGQGEKGQEVHTKSGLCWTL